MIVIFTLEIKITALPVHLLSDFFSTAAGIREKQAHLVLMAILARFIFHNY
jgi:hypothetical protein